MLLLAADTSGKNGTIALARGAAERHELKILGVVPLAGGTFSAQLVPQISALLDKCGYGKADLGAFAVVSGPGSFTGLRVGLAAIKGMAEVIQKPIAAISLLEAVARSGQIPGRVLAVLDAGRGEVYVSDYEIAPSQHGPHAHLHSERLLGNEEFLAEAKGKAVVTPDNTLAQLLRAVGIPCEQIAYPDSAVIARIGWERIQRGEIVAPETLDATYIRRSDAETLSQTKR